MTPAKLLASACDALKVDRSGVRTEAGLRLLLESRTTHVVVYDNDGEEVHAVRLNVPLSPDSSKVDKVTRGLLRRIVGVDGRDHWSVGSISDLDRWVDPTRNLEPTT